MGFAKFVLVALIVVVVLLTVYLRVRAWRARRAAERAAWEAEIERDLRDG
ncbi:hypothetical protein [Leucobacter sp. wl10]|nr:hypothetical protein [Leucobacter sp. wl10]